MSIFGRFGKLEKFSLLLIVFDSLLFCLLDNYHLLSPLSQSLSVPLFLSFSLSPSNSRNDNGSED